MRHSGQKETRGKKRVKPPTEKAQKGPESVTPKVARGKVPKGKNAETPKRIKSWGLPKKRKKEFAQKVETCLKPKIGGGPKKGLTN